jgi:uncharacterized protein YhbP (UPF0306 family)
MAEPPKSGVYTLPTGADIKRDTAALTAMVEAKTRAIMLAIQASAEKSWAPDETYDLAMKFYAFLMGDHDEKP